MPRKGPAPRHDLVADPIYKSVVMTQLINKVMLHGKRTIAEKIVLRHDGDHRESSKVKISRSTP